MRFRVETRDTLRSALAVNGEREWLFAWQCFMFSALESAEFSGTGIDPAPFPELMKAGCKIDQYGERILLEKRPGGQTVAMDLSACPVAALPAAVTMAAFGHSADIRGLHALLDFEGNDAASALQRALYRFGIHTDFCDRSKFKVLDTGKLRVPPGPVKVANPIVALHLLPLCEKTGRFILEAGENFPGKFQPWIAATGLELINCD